MKYPILLMTVACAASAAAAGVTMNMEGSSLHEGRTHKYSQVQYLEPEMARVELTVDYQDPEKKGRSTQKSVIITRLDKKVVWTLMPDSKGYCEFTFEELRKAVDSGSSLVPDGAVGGRYSYKKTGGARKIAGFRSDEYEISGKGLEGKAWLSSDEKLKPAAEFYAGQAKALGFSGGQAAGVMLGAESDSGKAKHSLFVRSAKPGAVPADKFALPAGYSKVNASAWKDYQRNFDPGLIAEQVKKRLKEEAAAKAKEAAAEKGKDALKQGLKGLIGR